MRLPEDREGIGEKEGEVERVIEEIQGSQPDQCAASLLSTHPQLTIRVEQGELPKPPRFALALVASVRAVRRGFVLRERREKLEEGVGFARLFTPDIASQSVNQEEECFEPQYTLFTSRTINISAGPPSSKCQADAFLSR